MIQAPTVSQKKANSIQVGHQIFTSLGHKIYRIDGAKVAIIGSYSEHSLRAAGVVNLPRHLRASY